MDPDRGTEFDFDATVSNIAECKQIASRVQDSQGDPEAARLLTGLAFDLQQQSLHLNKLYKERAAALGTQSLTAQEVVRI